MKGIKINKNLIYGLIFGFILAGTVAVTAISLTAKEITYTPTNTNFKVNNAYDALNFLYKLTDYAVPPNTYFYDSTTKGSKIKRYKKINNNFYICDVHGNVQAGTNPVQIDTSKLIEYKPELEENVSAGAAGYSNKNFILGNGLDVLNAENEGYIKGYADGKKDSNSGNGEIVYKRHHHTGTPGKHGGCYTKPVYHRHTGNHEYGNTSGCYTECGSTEFYEYDGWWYCSKCGIAISVSSAPRPSRCGNPQLSCGKSESTIESYTLGCGKKEGEIESATIVFK